MGSTIGYPALTRNDSTIQFRLGERVQDELGNEYVYLQGVASTVINDWVSYDEAHLTTRLVANAKGRVAVAKAPIVANEFGFYQIYGKATGLALTGYADNARVYSTATAGSIDDAVVDGDLIHGAIGRSAVSGGTATFELNYPQADDVPGANY